MFKVSGSPLNQAPMAYRCPTCILQRQAVTYDPPFASWPFDFFLLPRLAFHFGSLHKMLELLILTSLLMCLDRGDGLRQHFRTE